MKLHLATAIMVATLLLAAGCSTTTLQQNLTQNQTPAHVAECAADSDCHVGGCSQQLCTPKDGVMSTCEYRSEYACTKLTRCGCAQGQCTWANTTLYASCLQKASREQIDAPQ